MEVKTKRKDDLQKERQRAKTIYGRKDKRQSRFMERNTKGNNDEWERVKEGKRKRTKENAQKKYPSVQ